MIYIKNQSVVVPFDFSVPATNAIDAAIGMADESTLMHVIHVVVPIIPVISFDPAMPLPPSSDESRLKQAGEEMEKLFGSGKYARLIRHCSVGDPGSEIVNLANDVHANLIVMSSHGRTGLTRLLLGSVAERVLRLASCPVLVLRGDR